MLISPGVWNIQGKEGGRVTCTLLSVDGDLVLVDTGYFQDARLILAELKAIGAKASDIRHIIATHGHKSHISGLATIARMSGALVFASETERRIILGLEKAKPVSKRFPGSPLKAANWEVYGLQVALNLGIGSHTPYMQVERVKHGDRIGSLEIIGVPGHTPGSIAVFWQAEGVLITGDAVATWPQVDAGWPTFSLDDAATQRSIGLMSELPGVRVMCCGHGAPVTSGAADVLRGLRK